MFTNVLMCVVVACSMTLSLGQRVMYFYNGDAVEHIPTLDLSAIKNSPKFLAIDCSKHDCSLYTKTDYPALIYWKGAGSAFEKIYPHTQQAVDLHFLAKKIGPINKFRSWIEELNLLETIVWALLFGFLFFTIFTFLFSPNDVVKHRKSHKH